jgi:ABC-type dipeptide/oligopeptide/nickel transport system permease subunit
VVAVVDPEFVIVAIVLQFSLIGDWLRDVLDPRLLTR